MKLFVAICNYVLVDFKIPVSDFTKCFLKGEWRNVHKKRNLSSLVTWCKFKNKEKVIDYFELAGTSKEIPRASPVQATPCITPPVYAPVSPNIPSRTSNPSSYGPTGIRARPPAASRMYPRDNSQSSHGISVNTG